MNRIENEQNKRMVLYKEPKQSWKLKKLYSCSDEFTERLSAADWSKQKKESAAGMKIELNLGRGTEEK